MGREKAHMAVRTGRLLISEGWPVIQSTSFSTNERSEKLKDSDEFLGIVINSPC
ncbi:hypothetical protein [Mycobacterium uberis]|uniref:hypothetical protein n=1 Tax=Mycobacterium uberis TaxID=2162698 RepID=UPI0014032C37|nr:hypothetical protein [Mycobacterium uberis]